MSILFEVVMNRLSIRNDGMIQLPEGGGTVEKSIPPPHSSSLDKEHRYIYKNICCKKVIERVST